MREARSENGKTAFAGADRQVDPSSRRRWWYFWGAFALALAALELISGSSLGGDPEIQLAYLDPGAGSFVIQALVAMLAGIAVTVKVYWHRIKGFFGFATPDDDASEPRDED